MNERWKFPLAEGLCVRPETGEWSDAAFFNDLLREDEKFSVVWYQAEPAETNTNEQDWRRWREFLETDIAPKALVMVARLNAMRRLERESPQLPRRALRANKTSLLFVPLSAPEDVIPHLADPGHWKKGHSAYELAQAWCSTRGATPAAVRRVWDQAPEYAGAAVLWGAFEHTTRLDEFQSPSQTDLLLLVDLPRTQPGAARAIVAVEGKTHESFASTVLETRSRTGPKSKWPERVKRLCKKLRIDADVAEPLYYQLIHRAAAALLEAERLRAEHAMMLVHSFATKPELDRFGDYAAFTKAMGYSKIGKNLVSEQREFDGVRLRLAWVSDTAVG